MHYSILISLILLASCTTLGPKDRQTSYIEKTQDKTKSCVKELLKEGISERLTYPICKDIYSKKRLFRPRRRRHVE